LPPPPLPRGGGGGVGGDGLLPRLIPSGSAARPVVLSRTLAVGRGVRGYCGLLSSLGVGSSAIPWSQEHPLWDAGCRGWTCLLRLPGGHLFSPSFALVPLAEAPRAQHVLSAFILSLHCPPPTAVLGVSSAGMACFSLLVLLLRRPPGPRHPPPWRCSVVFSLVCLYCVFCVFVLVSSPEKVRVGVTSLKA
jgi:hypothetical protein